MAQNSAKINKARQGRTATYDYVDIVYQIATPGIEASANKAAIYKAQRFSDHAPLTIDYGWTL